MVRLPPLRCQVSRTGWRTAAARLLLCTGAALLLSLPAAGAAATKMPEPFRYARTLWRVSDGLPEDTVQALAESPDGVLWVGTTGGLARFDGAHLQLYGELYGRATERPLSVNSLFCLAMGRDGSLWAGTEGGGLLRLRGHSLKVYGAGDGLTDGFVRSVFEDDRGELWVGTDDGLFVLEGERLRRVDGASGLAPLAVHSITEDRQHRLWVGGSRLVALDLDHHLAVQTFALPGAYSQNRVKRILQTGDGTVWVGTVGGLERLESGRFRAVAGIHATVRSLLETSEGTLWIGTIGDGLWTLHAGQLRHIDSPGLLPSDTVLSIFEDDQSQVWIGTQAGLVRLDRTPVSVVPLPEGGDPDFETISGDDRGNVWVAAQSLYLIRRDVARRAHYAGLPNVPVRNVYRARDGALWIGTDGSGAYRLAEDGVTHYTAPQALTNNFIRGFLESRSGAMWIATDEGVSRIGPAAAAVQKFTQANGLAFFSTRSLLEDRDGSLWIGTDHGLSHLRPGGFVSDAATRALAQEKVWAILQDRDGTLWFGTRDHGLFRDRDGEIQVFTTAEGLPTNSIYELLQDRRGVFWLTGPNSIASVQPAGMEAAQPSPEQPLSVTAYSMPFGADGAALYGGRQPSGYLAPDDSVWFPTSRGAAHVARASAAAPALPRALVDDVIEDGRSIPTQGTLSVPAGVARLSFAFSAVSLRSQADVRFRYRLENFDPAWVIPGGGHEATYTNLRAGRYRFRVQAFNTARPAEVSEFDVVLEKRPFFYQTWWFFTLVALLLLALAWLVLWMRVRRLRARFAAVLEERSRLAREMHDTVIQGCTGISAVLEAMASTAEPATAAHRELLEFARVQARTTIAEARQAVWDMRHQRENDVDLIEALRAVAAQTTREYGTRVHFEHDAERVPVGASAAHEILMTVREAVYNSVQHSGSQQVEMQVRAAGQELAVCVADHGCGFSAAGAETAMEGHYGILGMRERVQRLGGRFELTSAAGAGTRVSLTVRLGAATRRGGER